MTVAALARDAGADPDEIPGWIAIGRERRVTANLPPFPGRQARRVTAAGAGLK